MAEDDGSIIKTHLYPTDHPWTCEEALLPLLCNEFRDIETLKDIEILPGGWKPSRHDLDLEFVEPAVEWFRERTLKRVYNAVEEMRLTLQGRSDQAAKDELQAGCDFCRKKHVLGRVLQSLYSRVRNRL